MDLLKLLQKKEKRKILEQIQLHQLQHQEWLKVLCHHKH